jgi:uncharacterized protein YdaU (DUF1376 family)
MHYYKRNLGDYAKKCGRLSMLQHGAYTLLLDSCYDRESFPTLEEAIDWTWASTEAEIEAVKFVLSRFFVLQDDGRYIQDRVLAELLDYHAKADTNKRIAIERETKRREQSTNRAQTVHEPPPNHKPRTNNQEPIGEEKTKERARPRASLSCPKPDNVSDEVWEGFAALRRAKKAPITSAAMEGIEREAVKARMSLQDALQTCCARGWAGFKAEWVQPTTQPQYNRRSIHDERADTIRQLTGRHREPAGEIIDIGGDPLGLDRAPF